MWSWLKTCLFSKKIILDFPYPYQGMLAFSSDVEFTSWDMQKKLISAFQSYSIPVSFSLWTYGDNDHTWCCFKDDGSEQEYIDEVMEWSKKGIFDTFHSFGGITDGKGTFLTRERFEKSYALFKKYNVVFPIYTNHGSVLDTQNIGGVSATYQKGDDPYHSHYHLDLTVNHGVQYFWTDIDYDNEKCLFDVQLHSPFSQLFRIMECRDGQKVLCFKRFRGTTDGAPTLTNFKVQLKKYLASSPKAYTIMYQHFGAQRDEKGKAFSAHEPFFDEETQSLLQEVANLEKEKKILLTNTSSCLNFARMQWIRPWTIQEKDNDITIIFDKEKSHEGMNFFFKDVDFRGFSMIVPVKKNVTFLYDGHSLPFAIWFEKYRKIVHIPFV